MCYKILFKASFCPKRSKSLYPIVQGTNLTWNSVPFSEHMCCGRSGGCSNVLVKMYLLRKRQECSSTGVFPAQGGNTSSFCPCSDRPLSYDPCPSFRLCYDFGWWCNLLMWLNKVGSTISLSSFNQDAKYLLKKNTSLGNYDLTYTSSLHSMLFALFSWQTSY